MSANSFNSTTCQCKTQQYSQIIFNSVAYQNSANNVYQAKVAQLAAANNGTLGTQGNGNLIFKSDYERMQYLLGKQNQGNSGAGCGVLRKIFALGTN